MEIVGWTFLLAAVSDQACIPSMATGLPARPTETPTGTTSIAGDPDGEERIIRIMTSSPLSTRAGCTSVTAAALPMWSDGGLMAKVSARSMEGFGRTMDEA